MTYRACLDTRFWLSGREYDLMTSDTVLHYDLFAYVDTLGGYWFEIEARQGGRVLVAVDLYALNSDGQLERRGAKPSLVPVAWDRRTNATFRRVHRALLSRCVKLPAFNRVSVHCHYVPVLDCDPWPRGTVNTFVYNGKLGGTGQGRPIRKHKTPRDVLPDLL